MPRHGELSWQVAQLESKVEFMMENLFTKMDRIYEISCCSDKNYHETELLRQEISLLRIRLHEMANQPIQCTCNHTKSSPSLSDVTMALMDSKKGAQAASNTANLWKKLKKTYKTPTPQNLAVDVKSIVAKFDETYNWNIGETDVSRPPSVAASVIGTPASVSGNPLHQDSADADAPASSIDSTSVLENEPVAKVNEPVAKAVSPTDHSYKALRSTKVSNVTATPKKRRLKAQFIFKRKQGGA